jgi:hypothetical protein
MMALHAASEGVGDLPAQEMAALMALNEGLARPAA